MSEGNGGSWPTLFRARRGRLAKGVMSGNLHDYRIEHLTVPSHREPQYDMAVQAVAFGHSRIPFVAFQLLKNEA